MKTHVDERLRHEAAHFSFRFACEDCVHAAADDGTIYRCSLGYPAAPRREDMNQVEIELCKSFEIF